MSHIANKIDAKDKNLGEILTGERYKIDVFQREYRWQRKQIEALISDLSISFLNNYSDSHDIENCIDYDCYYMGPIVLCKDGGSLSIVDGQQRLTSFTLLLIFMYHAQNELNIAENLRKDIYQYLYITKLGRKTLVLNVDSRNDVIEHLINNPEKTYGELETLEKQSDNTSLLDESIKNIIERYEDITALFPDNIKTDVVLPLFIEWLLDKVVLVEVKAYSMENAYSIFETMNDRGLSLNPTEILKGFLLSKIDDDEKSEELNDFWKERITLMKSNLGYDSDLDFFRSWLRAKYAISIRSKRQGAENEDFELIGTQFHSWIKSNPKKIFLTNKNDYYFFIRSDFDFYSSIYLKINSYKKNYNVDFKYLYINNFYPLADSLTYPIFLSPIEKIDDEVIINKKINIVSRFIDIYTNIRALSGRTLVQSSIRNSMYELIKSIRNINIETLTELLNHEIDKSLNRPNSPFTILHTMDNWGYYHYFYARILFFLECEHNFNELIRNRKQSSYILIQICQEDEIIDTFQDSFYEKRLISVANFCLIRRYHLQDFIQIKSIDKKLSFLIKNKYLPEMKNEFKAKEHIFNFIERRDSVLRNLTNQIWNSI